MVLAALTGAAGMIHEVASFRVMSLILGGSVYAFSIMLLSFLLGIGIGGWLGGARADRAHARGDRGRVMRDVARLQVAVAILAFLALYAYVELPFAFLWLYDLVASRPGWLMPLEVLMCIALMMPAALCMGATFPYLVRAAAGSADRPSAPAGHVAAANGAGAVIGAFLGGFVLLPALHALGTIILAVAINLAVAVAAMAASTAVPAARRALRFAAACAGGLLLAIVLRPSWNPQVMTAAMYHYAGQLPDRSRQGLMEYVVRPSELLFYDEGRSSVVTVCRTRRTGELWLANNGKVDASSTGDLDTQVLLGQLPMLVRPDAQRALVIGLASGITTGSMSLHRTLEHIDVFEIEPSMLRACRVFDEHNHRVLDDPRVRVVVNDARNQLLLTPDHAYDVISSEPSNPWISGVSNHFTREFFDLGKPPAACGRSGSRCTAWPPTTSVRSS
jgi:spermidine synthase